MCWLWGFSSVWDITLHYVHCTLCSAHCTMHTAQCNLCVHTAHCTPQIAHSTLYTSRWTPNTKHLKIAIIFFCCTLKTGHCSLAVSHCQVNSQKSTVQTTYCTCQHTKHKVCSSIVSLASPSSSSKDWSTNWLVNKVLCHYDWDPSLATAFFVLPSMSRPASLESTHCSLQFGIFYVNVRTRHFLSL